jgi:acyl-CoA thioester hydrolase
VESRFRFRHRLQVRFRDCDMMGHVNTAVYFTFIEQARFAYWREVTMGGSREACPSFIVARAECDFERSALIDEWLEVCVGATRIGRSSFVMDYEIIGEDGQIVARAKTVQVMFDYDAMKPFPVPDAIRARLEQYEGRTLGGQS